MMTIKKYVKKLIGIHEYSNIRDKETCRFLL